MMKEPFVTPLRNIIARKLMRPLFRSLFHILSPVKVTGLENVPKHGAYLLVFNHVSLYDAPFVVAFWPVAPEVAGAVDVWNRPGQSLLARLYGGIPVHRGEIDRRLVEKVEAVLQAGKPLMMAPEGGRSHTPGMRAAYAGVAYFVERTSVPVIPVGVVGATDDYMQRALRRERPSIRMHIGKPVLLPKPDQAGEGRKLLRQKNTEIIMRAIADTLPREYQGVYAS